MASHLNRNTVQQNPERTKDSAAVTAFKGFGLGLELEVVPREELSQGAQL